MSERINLILSKELSERLNAYCLKATAKKGKIVYALKTSILRKSLEEWLDNHEKDLNIDKLIGPGGQYFPKKGR